MGRAERFFLYQLPPVGWHHGFTPSLRTLGVGGDVDMARQSMPWLQGLISRHVLEGLRRTGLPKGCKGCKGCRALFCPPPPWSQQALTVLVCPSQRIVTAFGIPFCLQWGGGHHTLRQCCFPMEWAKFCFQERLARPLFWTYSWMAPRGERQLLPMVIRSLIWRVQADAICPSDFFGRGLNLCTGLRAGGHFQGGQCTSAK